VGLVQRLLAVPGAKGGKAGRGAGGLDSDPACLTFLCSASIIPRTHGWPTPPALFSRPRLRSSLQNKLKRTLRKPKSREKREGKGAAKTVAEIFGSSNFCHLFNFIYHTKNSKLLLLGSLAGARLPRVTSTGHKYTIF
jgi:hypothetical protein